MHHIKNFSLIFWQLSVTLTHAVLCVNILGEVIKRSYYLSEFVVEIHQHMNI